MVSDSKCCNVQGDKAVEIVFKSIDRLIDNLNIGDIIKFGNNVIGIVTKLSDAGGKAMAIIQGVAREVNMASVDDTAARYNVYDDISAPYNRSSVVDKARSYDGKRVSDPLGWAKNCRNGI